MYNIVLTNKFKSDFKRIKKRNYKLELLEDVMQKLATKVPLEEKHRDHALIGNYKGYRECHVQPDWLLIYYIDGDEIVFMHTGTHSDLFK